MVIVVVVFKCSPFSSLKSTVSVVNQRLTNDRDAAVPAAGGHAGTRRPDAGQRIIPFDAAQAGRAVETAAHVQQPMVGANAQTTAFRA